MGAIKEESIYHNEFISLEEASQSIGKWITNDYNKMHVQR